MVARFRHFANWFEQVDNFADYWNNRESQLKSTVKRKTGSLEREGRLAFEQIDLVDDLAVTLEQTVIAAAKDLGQHLSKGDGHGNLSGGTGFQPVNRR